MKKRLFLVAGYDANGIIDASLLHLVKSLFEHGDVIFVMDSDTDETELHKLLPYTIYANACRHGEYDFGSYKRAYLYARDNGILSNYEYLYMVNDSVYGPLRDIGPILSKMESFDTAAFGLVRKEHRHFPHIQSWFIGCGPDVFLSDWFDEFIMSVRQEKDKGSITLLYETGFSRLLTTHNIAYRTIWAARYRGIYNRVKHFYMHGLPFVKKVAFSRHYGAYGGQVLYILNHISPDLRNIILENAARTWGQQYIDKLLTRNPVKLIWRRIRYFFYKLSSEGI